MNQLFINNDSRIPFLIFGIPKNTTDAGFASLVWASISDLIRFCSPSAVAWLIVSVIINSVERQTFWPWSHINVKSLKTLNPSITHFDSSTAISMVISKIFIPASIQHRLPRSPNWRAFHSVRFSHI